MYHVIDAGEACNFRLSAGFVPETLCAQDRHCSSRIVVEVSEDAKVISTQ